MTLEQELQDPKSEKLKLLSEMLGLWPFCNIHKDHDNQDQWYCIKCGEITANSGRKCLYPDPITTDLCILAWQVCEKILELGLLEQWSDQIPILVYENNERMMATPTDWIEAGITVFKESKK